MTREEAVTELSVLWERYNDANDSSDFSMIDGDYVEALDIAIRSLEAWKNVQKEIYSQIDALDEIHEFRDKKAYFKALDIINKYLKEVEE